MSDELVPVSEAIAVARDVVRLAVARERAKYVGDGWLDCALIEWEQKRAELYDKRAEAVTPDERARIGETIDRVEMHIFRLQTLAGRLGEHER